MNAKLLTGYFITRQETATLYKIWLLSRFHFTLLHVSKVPLSRSNSDILEIITLN